MKKTLGMSEGRKMSITWVDIRRRIRDEALANLCHSADGLASVDHDEGDEHRFWQAAYEADRAAAVAANQRYIVALVAASAGRGERDGRGGEHVPPPRRTN